METVIRAFPSRTSLQSHCVRNGVSTPAPTATTTAVTITASEATMTSTEATMTSAGNNKTASTAPNTDEAATFKEEIPMTPKFASDPPVSRLNLRFSRFRWI